MGKEVTFFLRLFSACLYCTGKNLTISQLVKWTIDLNSKCMTADQADISQLPQSIVSLGFPSKSKYKYLACHPVVSVTPTPQPPLPPSVPGTFAHNEVVFKVHLQKVQEQDGKAQLLKKVQFSLPSICTMGQLRTRL